VLKPALVVLCATLLVHCSGSDIELRFEAPELPAGIVAENAEWEAISDGSIYSDGPVTDALGNFYYAAVIDRKIYKIDPQGERTVFDKDTAMTMGMVVSADNVMYGCRNLDAQIVRYDWEGNYEVLAEGDLTPSKNEKSKFIPGEYCNDLAVNSDGGIWFTDRLNRKIWYVNPNGDVRVVAKDFRPNGMQISLDRGKLYVGDSESPMMHAFSIGENGSIKELPGFFEPLVMPKKRDPRFVRPGTNGMTLDADGQLYVSTFRGIQVFDTNGSLLGIIRSPNGAYVSNLGFGGVDGQWLYATGRGILARIRMQSHSRNQWQKPVDQTDD
jgi:gluconolactonase